MIMLFMYAVLYIYDYRIITLQVPAQEEARPRVLSTKSRQSYKVLYTTSPRVLRTKYWQGWGLCYALLC